MDPKSAREQIVRDAKCSLILDAARKVFAEKGYWETRLDDIAAAAGFSKASLYNYYEDKESIFLSLSIREYEDLLENIRQRISSQANLRDNLMAMLAALFSHFGENFAFMLTVTNFQTMKQIHDDMQKHRELGAQFQEHGARILEITKQVIGWARSRNELASSLDQDALSRFIASLVRGAIFEWKVAGKMGDIDTTVEQIAKFVLSGAEYKSA